MTLFSFLAVHDCVAPARAALDWDGYFKIARRYGGVVRDDEMVRDDTLQMLKHLETLTTKNPDHAMANLKLAGLYLQEFDVQQRGTDNPMSLAQIRDAALMSQFTSRADQDAWLDRVLAPENRRLMLAALYHTKRALRLCPLQGEGYAYLANLVFLETPRLGVKQACIQQALIVRPHSGAILFLAGSEAAQGGDVVQALVYWKRAFLQDPSQQAQIIALLAPTMSAGEFLDRFEPDVGGLRKLFQYYRLDGDQQNAHEVAPILVERLVIQAADHENAKAAELWAEASSVCSFVGEIDRAVECALKAVEFDTGNLARHRLLAKMLTKNAKWEEAVQEWKWCLSRRPDDASLQRELERTNRLRLASRPTTGR